MPGGHSQRSGEQERQRMAVREQRNHGILIHFLLLFQACICSVLLVVFYTPRAAEAIKALARTPLSFPSLSTGSLRGADGVLPIATPKLRNSHLASSQPGLLFEPTFLSIHLRSNQPLLFSLTPTSSSWRQENNWGRCICFYRLFIILNGKSSFYGCFPPGRAFTLLELVCSCYSF